MYRGHVPSIKADDDDRERRVVSVLVSDRAREKRAKWYIKVYVVCNN